MATKNIFIEKIIENTAHLPKPQRIEGEGVLAQYKIVEIAEFGYHTESTQGVLFDMNHRQLFYIAGIKKEGKNIILYASLSRNLSKPDSINCDKIDIKKLAAYNSVMNFDKFIATHYHTIKDKK